MADAGRVNVVICTGGHLPGIDTIEIEHCGDAVRVSFFTLTPVRVQQDTHAHNGYNVCVPKVHPDPLYDDSGGDTSLQQ